jgi:surface polysaccharide O-acyltransferase-like enzyme
LEQQTFVDFLALGIFLTFLVWYYLFFAPRAGASIASHKGKDYGKWHLHIWFFNIFAILYLYFFLEDLDPGDKRTLEILTGGYLLFLFGAYCLDTFFNF